MKERISWNGGLSKICPSSKIDKGNRATCEISFDLLRNIFEQRHPCHFGVFIGNFEHDFHIVFCMITHMNDMEHGMVG